jgi:hypothetical protein
MIPCDLVDGYQLFTGTFYLRLQGRKWEAMVSCTMMVPFYQTTQLNIPEDHNIVTRQHTPRQRLNKDPLIHVQQWNNGVMHWLSKHTFAQAQ